MKRITIVIDLDHLVPNTETTNDRPEADAVCGMLHKIIDTRINRYGLNEAIFIDGPIYDDDGTPCGLVTLTL